MSTVTPEKLGVAQRMLKQRASITPVDQNTDTVKQPGPLYLRLRPHMLSYLMKNTSD